MAAGDGERGVLRVGASCVLVQVGCGAGLWYAFAVSV